MLQYLFDHGTPHSANAERQMYTTFLASAFRTLRFGITEAHGKGMALQFNYIVEKGGFVANADGTFAVDFARIKGAVRDLTRDLLTIEAEGDYAAAKKLLDKWVIVPPAMQRAFDALKSVPTDIDPVNER
jgi:hypothetical protein